MFAKNILVIFCLVLTACQPATELQPQTVDKASQGLKYEGFLADLAQRHIKPGYQQWLKGLTELQKVVAQDCQKAQSFDLNAAQQQWRRSMNDWQKIKWFKLGPIESESGHVRVQFWPDSNRAVERGLQKLLGAKQFYNSEKIAIFNVGAQGLPALERLMFDPEYAEVEPTKRCALIKLIVQNLLNIANKTVEQWQTEFTEQFTQGRGSFTDAKDALEEAVSVWLTQLIIILDNKISYPLSLNAPGIPQIAESPFADASTANLQANIHVYRVVFTANGGYGLDDLLIDAGQSTLANQILQEIAEVEKAAEVLIPSYTESLANEEGRQRLQQLTLKLRVLQKLLAVDMVESLNLNLGFNALDGD